ncbi:hypothetical protein GCM10020295_01680 [Streptomyces cinereospinus]
MRLWDAGFMALCAALVLAGGQLISVMTNQVLAVGMARNFLGYLGVALLLRPLAGPHVTTAAVALFPIACAGFGVHGGTPSRWAWPLHEVGSVAGFAQAAVLGAVGLVVAAVPHADFRRLRAAHPEA